MGLALRQALLAPLSLKVKGGSILLTSNEKPEEGELESPSKRPKRQ
jgi:hypothetical protein